MGWRDKYKVHPAAAVFPMMSDDELAALGEDIKERGVRVPIGFFNDGETKWLMDGRNRLEAAERAGVDPDSIPEACVHCSDPTSWVISLNIRRRHLTKQEQADLIVAAIKAGEKLDQVEPVSKGGRGKVNSVKAKAVAEAKKLDISEATVKRSIAKAEAHRSRNGCRSFVGRTPTIRPLSKSLLAPMSRTPAATTTPPTRDVARMRARPLPVVARGYSWPRTRLNRPTRSSDAITAP